MILFRVKLSSSQVVTLDKRPSPRQKRTVDFNDSGIQVELDNPIQTSTPKKKRMKLSR